MHRVLHAAQLLPLDGVAHLIGTLIDPGLRAAKLEHLRHEGQRFQHAVRVERAKDFFFASNFDELTDSEVEHTRRVGRDRR
jgi:hypothetical protein